jgi:hypothetical protein
LTCVNVRLHAARGQSVSNFVPFAVDALPDFQSHSESQIPKEQTANWSSRLFVPAGSSRTKIHARVFGPSE